MALLILGLAVFFIPHLYSAFRPRLAGAGLPGQVGAVPYKVLYSIVSLAGFVLIIQGYGEARAGEAVFAPPTWARHLNLLLMWPAFILLISSNGPVGHIKKAVRHPMLVAVKIWAVGHLVANWGQASAMVLFGAFLAYAVVDRIAVKRRGDLGPGPDIEPKLSADIVAVVVGTIAYAAFAFYLHPILFGVRAIV